MTNINFTRAVSYEIPNKSTSQRDLANIDGFFSCNGMRATVVRIDEKTKTEYAVLTKVATAWYFTALKVLAYLTIILPIIMLIAKAIARSQHKIVIIDKDPPLLLPTPPVFVPFPKPPLTIIPPQNKEQYIPTPLPSPTPSPTTSPVSHNRSLSATTLTVNTNFNTNTPTPNGSAKLTPTVATVPPRHTNTMQIIQHQARTGTLPKNKSLEEVMIAASQIARNNTIRKLKAGLGITQTHIDEIQGIIDHIIKRNASNTKPDNLIWIAKDGSGNTLVFKLKSLPDVVFKIGNPKYSSSFLKLNPDGLDAINVTRANDRTESRFNNIVNAQQVIDDLKLNLLELPAHDTFKVKYSKYNFDVVAEGRLDFDTDVDHQMELYDDPDLLETIKQLAVFTGKLGADDVEFRNFPILKPKNADINPSSSTLKKLPKKIGLIDLDSVKSIPEYDKIGMFGTPAIPGFKGAVNRAGVMGLVFHEDHVEAISQIAKGFNIPDDLDARGTRLAFIKEHKAEKAAKAATVAVQS